jgi:MFS family permease
VKLHHFTAALFLLGVGWNFLFTGGTTLSLSAYSPQEKDRAQGAINFLMFAVMAFTSFTSGALVSASQGWSWLNMGSLGPVVVMGLGLGWLAMRRRAGVNAA